VFIFAAYASGFPLSLSVIASDVAEYTKKPVVSAILFLAYCAGSISGPQSLLREGSVVLSDWLQDLRHLLVSWHRGYLGSKAVYGLEE
jgi:hypothetical protein